MAPPATEAAMSETASTLRQQLIRNTDEVKLERQERAPLYDTRCGGITDGMVAKKLGAGFDILAPGKRSCPYHYHLAQEEMFVILQGTGSLRVAGELLPVRSGDVVVIPPGPEYPHQFINTSDAPMHYLSISTQERPEICYYPDSGKIGAFAKDHRVMTRRASSIDYWDGEP
jgi:uncharacterized cupin superfamily protein